MRLVAVFDGVDLVSKQVELDVACQEIRIADWN
jgi:hypothetical protein